MHGDVGYAGEVTLKAYVFGDSRVDLSVVEAPDRWDVTVSPEIIEMPPQDYTYMELGGEYRKIAPVTVTVNVPSDPEDGQHQIRVRVAETGTSNDASQVAVTASQLLTFTVDVVPPSTGTPEEPDEQDELLPSPDGPFRGIRSPGGDDIQTGTDNTLPPDNTDTAPDDDGDDDDADGRDRERDRTDPGDDFGESVQDQQEDAGEQDAAGITGLVTQAAAVSTAVNVLVFIAIWSIVAYVVVQRREQKQEQDDTLWDV